MNSKVLRVGEVELTVATEIVFKYVVDGQGRLSTSLHVISLDQDEQTMALLLEGWGGPRVAAFAVCPPVRPFDAHVGRPAMVADVPAIKELVGKQMKEDGRQNRGVYVVDAPTRNTLVAGVKCCLVSVEGRKPSFDQGMQPGQFFALVVGEFDPTANRRDGWVAIFPSGKDGAAMLQTGWYCILDGEAQALIN
jgi:hypothetical protein